MAQGCGEDDILVALVSGGGSALLSCPVPGMTVEEKRKVSMLNTTYPDRSSWVIDVFSEEAVRDIC